VSASSAENPDSFEIHKFLVSTTNSHTREEPNKARKQQQNQQQQQSNKPAQQQRLTDDQTSIPQMLEDVAAANIRATQDQFADLHNRIQILNNRVSHLTDLLENLVSTSSSHQTLLTHIDDRSAATLRNVEKVERTSMAIQRDLESKDFKDMMMQIHRALESNHEGLVRGLPGVMGEVAKRHGPSLTVFLFAAVAVQIMVTGAYVVWKKRRGGGKKYL
jgi:mannose-binding lectin 1